MAITLSLCASGHTTSTVTIPGDGVSHTVPIYESYALHHAILHRHGRDLTQYLETARDVKEKLRCFGADHDKELKSTSEINKDKTNELPDGNISIDERFHCVDTLFQPNFIGERASGIHDTSLQSNMKCGVYTRKFYTPCRVVDQTHDVGPIHDKDQGGCSIQDESTRLDWRTYLSPSFASVCFFLFFLSSPCCGPHVRPTVSARDCTDLLPQRICFLTVVHSITHVRSSVQDKSTVA